MMQPLVVKRSIKYRARVRAFFRLPPLGGEGWGGGYAAE